MVTLPLYVETWFQQRGWQVRAHQSAMIEAFEHRHSTLLIAPTGGGKTLAGFLASLIDIHETGAKGLHTLYISPLKALTNDIARNLTQPVLEMGLKVSVESRTGDTPSYKRKRQSLHPPHILLTTPESLMLMLSYPDAAAMFGSLKLVILDEVHSFAASKRGDFTALALGRLATLAPGHIRFGLSATVAEPPSLAAWLGEAGKPAQIVETGAAVRPVIRLLRTKARLPYGAASARYAVPEIFEALKTATTAIVFVNTRAQAELMFSMLWDINDETLPIAIYHGSLTPEQRRKTEAMMASGGLRAVVATSALELGIDWGDVDLVIQIGAPKGVSRLMQRIGRSNHRMDAPSRALLVPGNHFEVLECVSAMQAIEKDLRDGETLIAGSLDVVAQYILNCACAEPVQPDALYREIGKALPYSDLPRAVFDQLFAFVVDGGYVLRNYERYARLKPVPDGYLAATAAIVLRHRQNIGVIMDGARLRVRRLNKGRGGRVVGDIDEGFAQNLAPGDTFFLGGEVLEYMRVRDMFLEARTSTAKEPKIPVYSGNTMPLSSFLADGVRDLLQNPDYWKTLPESALDWLNLQRRFSRLPAAERLLIEHFKDRKQWVTVLYTFEGRRSNQTLGLLVTRRMECMGLKPLSFTVTDYALCVASLSPLDEKHCEALLDPGILAGELDDWMAESSMLKRSFRRVAYITGLTEQRIGGMKKNMKQMTFSTDLIYDVLRRYEPDHILLKTARDDAERDLLDTARLSHFLQRYENRLDFTVLKRPSPMAIPVITERRRNPIQGEALDELLQQSQGRQALSDAVQDLATELMDDVRRTLES